MQISVNLKFLLKSLSHYCRCFLHPLVFDTNILQRDMRDNGQTYHKWSAGAELVSLVCDPHNTILFPIEDDMIEDNFMKFKSWTATFTLHAHSMDASSISFCPSELNFIATGGTDKIIRTLH